MKRVKLMILSFCVLAVVAGALAFKAKGPLDFCYATANSTSPFCSDHGITKKCIDRTTIGKTTTQNFFYCTTPTSGMAATPCLINGQFLDCGPSVRITPIE